MATPPLDGPHGDALGGGGALTGGAGGSGTDPPPRSEDIQTPEGAQSLCGSSLALAGLINRK